MRSTVLSQAVVLFRKQKPTELIPPELGGLRVKPSARARRMGLRVEAKTGDVVFTWPLRARLSAEKALRFIEENRGWIERQKKQAVAPQLFAPGTVLSIAGESIVIEQGQGRGLTRLEDGRLIAHGKPEHLSRRIRDFLRAHAAEVLTALADAKAQHIGLAPSAVRILDPKSRWGSCAPDGKIMFSWRLLLAPYEVMDYVVAHEVAHRVHLNHSRRFWKLCAELTTDAGTSRRWLRQNGRQLMAYR